MSTHTPLDELPGCPSLRAAREGGRRAQSPQLPRSRRPPSMCAGCLPRQHRAPALRPRHAARRRRGGGAAEPHRRAAHPGASRPQRAPTFPIGLTRRAPCSPPLRAPRARWRLTRRAARRPQAELHEWLTSPPDSWRLTSPAGGDDGALLRCWELLLEGAGLYENEVFTLRVRAVLTRRARGARRETLRGARDAARCGRRCGARGARRRAARSRRANVGDRACRCADERCSLPPFKVSFLPDYPMQAPEFCFLRPAPLHPHIYSNGALPLRRSPARGAMRRAALTAASRVRRTHLPGYFVRQRRVEPRADGGERGAQPAVHAADQPRARAAAGRRRVLQPGGQCAGAQHALDVPRRPRVSLRRLLRRHAA